MHGAGDAFGLAGPNDGAWGLTSDYQAIETFRLTPGYGFSPGDAGGAVRTFRSSGTTQGERATSLFSQVGLDFYELSSLIAFFSMILRVFPGEEAHLVPGVSLVPPVAEWPESSLAQMVAWIAREAPVAYREDAGGGDRPRWLFGTAFHFVNLMDAGKATKLPEGSLIIETGGTKGRSREVSRAGFYAELSRAFGVPRARIVSEYGMSELAVQAYDFDGGGFRWPFWVTPAVVTGPGTTAKRGDGLLLVADPLRVDHARAIRVEDMARLRGDGSFELLGRAPKAPLKGCSLLAEEVVAARVPAAAAGAPYAGRTIVPDFSRADRTRRQLFHFLTDGEVHGALTDDLGGEPLAKAALDDLGASVPETEELWRAAMRTAAGDGPVPARWLFILPGNHPLVGVYPLAMAAALGLEVTVRVPDALAGDGRFLPRLVAAFGATAVSAATRIDAPADAAAFDAILVYGDDATVAAIKAASGGKPVVGFGTRAGVALVDGLGTEPKSVKSLARDAFGLAQAGCMSVRLAVVIAPAGPDGDARSFVEAVRKAGEDFLHTTLIPPLARIGQELEQTRLAALGFDALAAKSARTPLILWRRGLIDHAQALALRPFTLPIIVTAELPQALLADSTIGTVTASPRLIDELSLRGGVKNGRVSKSFRLLGRANAPVWDGRHEGVELFRAN